MVPDPFVVIPLIDTPVTKVNLEFLLDNFRRHFSMRLLASSDVAVSSTSFEKFMKELRSRYEEIREHEILLSTLKE